MRHCKNCGTVFSDVCASCPKCQCVVEVTTDAEQAINFEAEPEKTQSISGFERFSWLWLGVGLCGFIGILYLAYHFIIGAFNK